HSAFRSKPPKRPLKSSSFRRSFHGRNRENSEPEQNRHSARQRRRLLTRSQLPRRQTARPPIHQSKFLDYRLHQLQRGSEGSFRRHRHQRQRRQNRQRRAERQRPTLR